MAGRDGRAQAPWAPASGLTSGKVFGRSVAQPGSAPASGAGGRRFEPSHSDQKPFLPCGEASTGRVNQHGSVNGGRRFGPSGPFAFLRYAHASLRGGFAAQGDQANPFTPTNSWITPNGGLGPLAQLVEHLPCKQDVIGSIPIGSTISIRLQGRMPRLARRGEKSVASAGVTGSGGLGSILGRLTGRQHGPCGCRAQAKSPSVRRQSQSHVLSRVGGHDRARRSAEARENRADGVPPASPAPISRRVIPAGMVS